MADSHLPAPSKVRHVAFIVLPLMYLAGLIGLNTPALSTFFIPLIPFNLLASLGLLLLFHNDWRPSFWLYSSVALLGGFLIEVVGVHTGLVFGTYAYGTALGYKIAEVPVVIGTNWLMLTYCCGSVVSQLPVTTPVRIAVASGLMTLLDVLIEPVAMHLDFWQWQSNQVPVQNYVAWYVISVFLFLLYYKLPFQKTNALARWLLLLQFMFFGLNELIRYLG
jgi:hypothetical protein